LMDSCTLEQADANIRDMKRRLEAKGRSRMKYAIPGRIYMGKTDHDAKKKVENLVGGNVNLLKEILATDFVGSPQTIAERIQRLSEIGFDYVIFSPSPALSTLIELGRELLPRL